MQISSSFISVFNSISDKIVTQYAHTDRFTHGSGIGCALIATEMAIRVMINIHSGLKSDEQVRELSNHLAGAFFYGICSTNYLPGTPVLGCTIFSAYSLMKMGDAHYTKHYIITRIFNETLLAVNRFLLRPITEHIVLPLTEFVINRIIQPIFTEVIIPLANLIKGIATTVLGLIHLPSNPTWYGVALLGVAIILRHQGIF